MNIFELKIWDDERQICTFYTVQFDGAEDNETDKFLLRYEDDEGLEESVQELLSFVLNVIGDYHGAIDELFNRYENEVTGLPVQGRIRMGEVTYYYPNFPLRLYALKITENIVVLFNGGLKDGPTNQTSSLNLKWVEACQFARRIIDAISAGEVIVDERNRKLINNSGIGEIIL